MDTRKLLTHLEKLEYGLDSFSFSELKCVEASELKRSFNFFKTGLEAKVFGAPIKGITAKNPFENGSQHLKETLSIDNLPQTTETSLKGIVGFLDLLKATNLTNQQWQLVNAMDTASKRLLQSPTLVEGQGEVQKTPFNPLSLVNEVSSPYKELINGKQVGILVHCDKDIPRELLGNPATVSQVLHNLIGSAIKSMKTGEIRLVVNLKGEKNKKVLLEFVVSTGFGTTNEQLNCRFQSDLKLKPCAQLKYNGPGFDLKTVRETIEKEHGSLAVSGVLGKGATFRVIMPFGRIKASAMPKNIADMDVALDISGKSILVLEGDVLIQKIMEDTLDQWGCKSYITENRLYGLQLLERHNIDFVLLDKDLAEMDGFRIVKRIRRTPKRNDLPIILLSGDAGTTQKEIINELGINDFILKPYNADELLKKIRGTSKNMKRT